MKNPSSYKKIGTVIEGKTSYLHGILAKVKEIQLLSEQFRTHLPTHMQKYCFVVNTIENRLVVMTANSGIATQLKFQTSEILAKMQLSPELKNICHLHIKISPSLAQSKVNSRQYERAHKIPPLSMASAQSVMDTAKSLDDPKLSEIMARIATHCME